MTPSEKLTAAQALINTSVSYNGLPHMVTGAYIGVTGEAMLIVVSSGIKRPIPAAPYLVRDANSCPIVAEESATAGSSFTGVAQRAARHAALAYADRTLHVSPSRIHDERSDFSHPSTSTLRGYVMDTSGGAFVRSAFASSSPRPLGTLTTLPNLFPCGGDIARSVANAVGYGLMATQRETLAQRMASARVAVDAEVARWKGAKAVCDAVHTEYGHRLLVWMSLGNNAHTITVPLWESDSKEREWSYLASQAHSMFTVWAEHEGLSARRK